MLNPITFSYHYDIKIWMRRYREILRRLNLNSNINARLSCLEHELRGKLLVNIM